MNWKVFKGNSCGPISYLSELRKTTRTSVSTVGLQAEISAQDSPHTKLELYKLLRVEEFYLLRYKAV
jgi:hypothetical protein